ncbi:filamentous hemagglutinin N-terminal domain-containing protein [Baaleninema sp.]|uniref:two-partner secretion domain-containing protein n=1 Tax=Baaleninema sp. TaxID=3101197 RepID=UPI003D01381C
MSTVNSQVERTGNNISIEAGTQINELLFHSFSEFSVPADAIARFNNSAEIQTIFSRVTGGDISRLDGTLAANGTANLFFLNPNGIVFGENARLDIGGSFLASTAESLHFANGESFSTVEPETSLLTVQVPLGLQFSQTPGDIVNRSRVNSELPNLPENFPTARGLTVLPGRTLALIGGDLRLESGDITAFQGEIQLASVASRDRLEIRSTPTGIEFDGRRIDRLGTIDISGTSRLDVSGFGSGAIAIRGSDITIRDNSQILGATLGDLDGRSIVLEGDRITLRDGVLLSATTFGAGRGGDLRLQASQTLHLIGLGFPLLLELERQTVLGKIDLRTLPFGVLAITHGTGDAGDVRIDSDRLRLQNGAILVSATGAVGNSGDLQIRARDSVEVDRSFISTGAIQGTTGNAGNLRLETQTLRLTNSGIINAIVLGDGNGGNIDLIASEAIEAIDTPLNVVLPSGLFTQTISGAGKGGNINVRTPHLSLAGGAQINAQSGQLLGSDRLIVFLGGVGGNIDIDAESIVISGSSANGQFSSGITTTTFSDSRAGNISITADELNLREGASVEAATFGGGVGGSIDIETRRLELSGTGIANRQGIAVELPTRLAASSGQEDFPNLIATGTAGDLRVEADEIVVGDSANITVTSQGTGGAGTLTLNT